MENKYVRIPVLMDEFSKLSQMKRELEAEEGRDITWGEFLLRVTDK